MRHARFFNRKVDPGVTYSGGLVFCHSNAPIHAIKALTSDLADVAKNHAPDGRKGDYLVYQTLESFDAAGSDLDVFCTAKAMRRGR